MPITEKQVLEKPTSYRFNGDGMGYSYVGELSMPALAIHPPSAAMPPAGTEDGTWHMLKIPSGEQAMSMQWCEVKKVWKPGLASGAFRVAFSCAYLAANGWTYSGAA
jgi:hypothetical protein